MIISSIVTDAVRANRPVLLMAHRAELIEQLHDKLADHFVDAGIIKAGHPRRDRPVQVASVQTLRSRGDFPAARLLIFDEAHHAIAPTYRMIADEYPHAKILGFTATPCKPSGGGLGYDVFDAMVCGPTVPELIEMGALVQPVVYSVPAEGLDSLRTTAGDYNQKDLAKWADKSVLYGDLVATYRATADGRKCVVFAVSVELSQRYAREYNEAGIRAEHIDGTTPADERAAIFARFRSGITRVLCNVAVATEGVDIPDCSVVQVARPTKSIPLYLQMVGRAMRPHPDKTDCIILDHGNATKACGFPDAVRVWDLDGTRKMKRETVHMVELDLGLPEAERRDIEHLHMVQLQRIDPPKERDPLEDLHPELRRLIILVDQKGWKNEKGQPKYAWAVDEYRKTGATPTREELEIVRKRAGYHVKWTDRQVNIGHLPAIKEGLDSGKTITEVAKEVGAYRGSLAAIAREAGVQMPTRSEVKRNPNYNAIVKTLKDCDGKRTDRSIGVEFGVSGSSVGNIRKKIGIKSLNQQNADAVTELLRHYEGRISDKALHRRTGVSIRNIRALRLSLGWPPFALSEAKSLLPQFRDGGEE